MPYSVINIDGCVSDINYRRVLNSPNVQSVFLNDLHLGQLFNLGSLGWDAVSHTKANIPRACRNVSGFKSKRKATEHLLKLYSVHGNGKILSAPWQLR